MDRKKRLGNPESGGPQAPEARDTTPGCLALGRVISGRGPHPLEKGKSVFDFCSWSLWAPCDLDSLGIVCDGAGLGPPAECEGWNDGGVVAETIETEGGRVRERRGLWRTAKLPLNPKRVFFGLLFLYFSHLIKQIRYCSLERRF